MSTNKKKINKYAADRKMLSSATQEGRVAIAHFISSPRTSVEITAELSEDAKHDLAHAIDDVLAHHGQ